MSRKKYFREYHARNREKRRAQMRARYYALGGYPAQKLSLATKVISVSE
jgi:hypothetical protein